MKNNSKTLKNDSDLNKLVDITKEKIKETEQGKEFIIADLFNEDNWNNIPWLMRTNLGRQIGRYNEKANILIVLDKDDEDRQRYRKK